jgi:hypothetical protein
MNFYIINAMWNLIFCNRQGSGADAADENSAEIDGGMDDHTYGNDGSSSVSVGRNRTENAGTASRSMRVAAARSMRLSGGLLSRLKCMRERAG